MSFKPHDNRILVKPKDDTPSAKLDSGLYAPIQANRRWQTGVVYEVGDGPYVADKFKPMDALMYFNGIEVLVDGKVFHLVDASNILGFFIGEKDGKEN